MRCPPQRGQTKPPGQRRFDKKAAQLTSSGNISRNCESDRPLAIVRPVADVQTTIQPCRYTTSRATWDSGISHTEQPDKWDERLPIFVLPEDPARLNERLGKWLCCSSPRPFRRQEEWLPLHPLPLCPIRSDPSAGVIRRHRRLRRRRAARPLQVRPQRPAKRLVVVESEAARHHPDGSGVRAAHHSAMRSSSVMGGRALSSRAIQSAGAARSIAANLPRRPSDAGPPAYVPVRERAGV